MIALILCVVLAALVEAKGLTAKQLFTPEEFKTRLGAQEKAFNGLPRFYHPESLKADLPVNFDSRTQWPSCMMPVRDQGNCGSCWAFGAVEALADRVCINGVQSTPLDISAQWLVNCDRGNMGCMGGTLPNVWGYLAVFGAPEDSCLPYLQANGDCTNLCEDGTAPSMMYYANAPAWFPPDDLESIMTEIYNNGPLETAFSVYADFYENYTGGVYKWDGVSAYQGGHAIKAMGWGHDDESGMDYWIAQNSWGPAWGEEGFFRIHRGANDCGFEGQMTGGRASATSYVPPVPEFAADYYTVILEETRNRRVGQRIYVKAHGDYSRVEEYSPDEKLVIVTRSGSSGWRVTQTTNRHEGHVTCKCETGTIYADDIMDISSDFRYVSSEWSSDGTNLTLQEQIVSSFTYSLPGVETSTYNIAAAAVLNSAYPWTFTSTVFGIKTDIDFCLYVARSEDFSMFNQPCTC